MSGGVEFEFAGKPASSDDCICCDTDGGDIDRMLVSAFIAGVVSRDQKVPIGEALCAKHGEVAKQAISFVLSMGAS